MNITFAPERRQAKQIYGVDPIQKFDEDNTRLWMALQQQHIAMHLEQASVDLSQFEAILFTPLS